MKKVAIVMGSKSDYHVCQQAEEILKQFDVQIYKEVVSAHRTPERLWSFSLEAEEKYSVIIAAAGGSAHLPGMIAANTLVPVIGLPIKSSTLNGVDSLLSIVQMPPGIPVATVAINGGVNAGLLALQILGITNLQIRQQLSEYRLALKVDVETNHNGEICK